MKDARDSHKISSLPDDLKSIAEEMLEDKFGLPKKGEVQEKPKKASSSKTGMSSDTWGQISGMMTTTQSNYATSTLTLKDLQNAIDSMRSQQSDYGMSPQQWANTAREAYDHRTYPFRPEFNAFELVLESPYTRRRVTTMVNLHNLKGYGQIDELAYYAGHMVERYSREYMEPFVIRDPSGNDRPRRTNIEYIKTSTDGYF